MLLSSLALVFLPIALAAKQPKIRCLPSGDETRINEALSTGGTGAVVTLCPGSTHMLQNPIMFTATRQTLTTEGNPKGRDRAMIVVKGKDQAVAVKADCRECGFATVRSVIIDGNRPEMLRVPKGGALIEMGNAEMQTVRDCRLYEPRGWSCLHLREGDLKQCRKGHIVGNDIGPCGEEWDDEYDGTDEMNPVNGNPRADGISVACQDSLVERNVITDATDGGIVLFGSSGTECRENQVFTRTRVLLGGINMVDYEPWRGDYFGVKVHHNSIYAYGGFIKVGIVVGLSAWSDDTEKIVHSGWAYENSLHGGHFGYGYVVSSAEGFTVIKNTIGEDTVFAGVPGVRCPKAPPNGAPTAFLIHRGSVTEGTFQDEFVNGEVQHIICIDPPPVNGVPYKPWRLRDDPDAKKVDAAGETEEENAGPVSFDSRLAEAVVVYQMKILNAIGGVSNNIERKSKASSADDEDEEASKVKGDGGKEKSKTGIKSFDALEKKVELFESGERNLQREMDAIHRELGDMSRRIQKAADDSKPILADVFKAVSSLPAPPSPKEQQRVLGQKSKTTIEGADDGIMTQIGPFWTLLLCVGALFVAYNVLKRWRTKQWSISKGKVR